MNKRRSIEVAGLKHVNPIPNGCRIGPFLMTGVILGKDPATGQVPQEITAQCKLLFENVRRILDAAGAAPEDVIKLNFWVTDKALREHINKEWVAMFPDPHSRPARHTFTDADQPSGARISCDVTAVIGSAE